MQLPSSQSYPTGQRISADGISYSNGFVLVAADTGMAYLVTIAGTPPALTLTPIPTCSTIDGDFATCAALDAAVPTCAALRTWGFA